jgi:hypothetical protein
MRKQPKIPDMSMWEAQQVLNILAFEDGYRGVSPTIDYSRGTLFCTLVPKDGAGGFPGSFPAARVVKALETVRMINK